MSRLHNYRLAPCIHINTSPLGRWRFGPFDEKGLLVQRQSNLLRAGILDRNAQRAGCQADSESAVRMGLRLANDVSSLGDKLRSGPIAWRKHDFGLTSVDPQADGSCPHVRPHSGRVR